jgi:selenide,water dikinase
MLAFQVHGCTDVTGFGLIGHAREMALGSKTTIEIDTRALQFLPGALEYARLGAISGGLKNNREFASSCVAGNSEFDDLLYDPQTSGGLLIALPERDAALLEGKLPGAYRVGRVTERQSKPIHLL